jgi:hypothetical protein
MSGLFSSLALRQSRRTGLRLPVTEDREIRAIHAAQVAAGAFISVYQMWRVIAFGVKRRGKFQDVGRTELDAETTALTAFGHDNDGASIQGVPLLPYLQVTCNSCSALYCPNCDEESYS